MATPRGKDILALPAAEKAVLNEDIEEFTSILDDITDIDIINELLYLCAKRGQVEFLKLLLGKGGDPVVWVAGEDETALSAASGLGHVDVVTLFVDEGAGCDVNVKCKGDMHTALHSSAEQGQLHCTKVLLEHKADGNVKDCLSHTPLMKACKNGHADVVKLLLQYGADPSAKTLKRENAFTIALNDRQADCVRELLKNRPEFSTERTTDGLLPLTHAIRFRDVPLVQAFVDSGCDLNTPEGLLLTPLQLAIETGHIPTIKTLLKGDCRVNSPLGLPTGSTPLMLAVCKGRADIVGALIDSGCELDAFDRHGRTALYLAVKHGFLQCVHKLLKAGADPDGHMFDEMQPEIVGSYNALQCAVVRNKPEETLALIQSGCNLFQGIVYEDAQDHGAFTAFQCALGRDCRWAVRVLARANPAVINSVEPYTGNDEEIKFILEEALQLTLKPKTLKILCRNSIRTFLGNKKLFHKIPLLALPLPLEDYLLFKELEYLV